MLRIRPYRPDELPRIIDCASHSGVENLVQRDLPGATRPGVAGQMARMFTYVLSVPESALLVVDWPPGAQPDGKPAGYALLLPQPNAFTGEREVVVMDIFTHPALRGQGVGKALLARAAEYARALGAGGLVAQIALHNQASLALFRSAGYAGERVVVGRRLT
jgi:GNAT superfamily N-acetyltransferase